MVDVKIVPFEPETASPDEWARFHAFRRQRHQETDPEDPVPDDRPVEAYMRRPSLHWEMTGCAVVDPDRAGAQIGRLSTEVARPGAPVYEANQHCMWVGPEVLRPYRRQGIGRRLLAEAARRARSLEKSLLVLSTDEEDGKAFVGAIGAQVASRFRQSRLRLEEVDWAMVEEWAQEGPRRSPQTALRWFTGSIDEDALEAFCAALTEVWNDKPRGDLEIGDEAFTPDRRRDNEARRQEGKVLALTAVTQEPSGEISGLTEMGYLPGETGMIHQWMTGVRKRHRGRGLGKWLKGAMLLRIREELPQVRVVVTSNATTNAAMLSINRRLGFKPYREGLAAQVRLEDLEAYLHSRAVA